MKNYYKYILLFSAFAFVLLSCEENYESTDTETETSEPSEIESVPLTGKVADTSGNPISSAEVVLFQGDKEIVLTTDDEGSYQLDLPDVSERIFLQAAATEFVTSSIATIDPTNNYTKNFTLLQQDELLYSGGEVKSLGGGTLKTITGQVLLDDGSPAAHFNVLLIDFNQIFASPRDFIFTYVMTDADGFYSITHEPFENYMLLVHDDCISQSNFEFITQQLTLEDVDIDLGVYQSGLQALASTTLSGFITDCNTNEGLDEGVIYVELERGITKSARIIDGVYSLEFPNCEDLNCLPVTIMSEGAFVGYSRFDCYSISNSSNTLDHELCGDDRIQEGEIRLLVDSDSIIYERALAGPPGTSTTSTSNGYWIAYFDFSDLSQFFKIEQEGTEIGTFPVTNLEIAQNFEILYSANSNGSNSLVEFKIDRLDSRIAGTISGLVVNTDGDLVPISGTYDIEL